MSTNPAIPAALREHLARDGGKLERAFSVERASVNVDDRTVTLAFASELPYERWWGIEILECTSTAMRQNRMRSGANLLCDHDTRDVIGVVESVDVGTDRVVRAVVRFGRSARAEEVFQDVVGGIRRNVSVGYMLHKAVLVETKDGQETYRVTDWEPFEVSLVSVPADPTVGVGRALSHSDAQDTPVPVLTPTPNPSEVRSMTEAVVTSAPVAAPTPAPVIQVESRNHAAEITKIAASLPGGAELAMRSIQAGHTVEQFQVEAIRALSTKPLPTADIGMTDKEVRRYSILKVARALADPSAYKDAGFELECSQAVAQKMGRIARGFMLPYDVQAKRDLVVGTPTAGGNLVATDLLMGSFIQMLRNAMVIDRLGTRMLTGLVGNVAIPKQTGGSTIYWVAENTAPTESQQAIGQVTLSPKTAGGFTDIGRTLMNQTSLDVENFVMSDLASNLGLGIQLAAIAGTGASNQPSGLLTRITPSVIGGTNGLAPTWQHMIDLETNVAVANADVGTMSYLTNAKVRGKLKSTQKFAGTNGMPVWVDGATPVNGYNAAVTNGVPSNLVKGTSGAVCSAILFGNFNDLMIGMWGATDLIRDPYANSTTGGVRIVALQDVDVNVRNTESFATMVDALTV
jgi:HK97 family phage major capsid protein